MLSGAQGPEDAAAPGAGRAGGVDVGGIRLVSTDAAGILLVTNDRLRRWAGHGWIADVRLGASV